MTDRELIKKLNNLQNFQPDAAFLKSNREILFAQISNSSVAYNPGRLERFSMAFKNIFSTIYQPVAVMAVIVLFLGSGLIFGHNFLNVNPNNSLYIAKVISERARLGIIFDETAKEKMAADFANDHAQTIASTLSSSNNINSEDLNELNDRFKSEVDLIKNSIKKPVDNSVATLPASISAPDDAAVAIAGSEKDASGVSVYNPNAITNTNNNAICSSTNDAVLDPSSILDEAEKLFEAKDYDGAVDKLKAANEVINK